MTGTVTDVDICNVPITVVEAPWLATTTLRWQCAPGFGDDPEDFAGVAHLCEHLLVSRVQKTASIPVVVRGLTNAWSTDLVATASSVDEIALLESVMSARVELATNGATPGELRRQCDAIDVEITDWFADPLRVAGYPLAAAATGQPGLARFGDCVPGDSGTIPASMVVDHCDRALRFSGQQLVIATPSDFRMWLPALTQAFEMADVTPQSASTPLASTQNRAASIPGDRVFATFVVDTGGGRATAEAAFCAVRALVHESGPLRMAGMEAGMAFRGGTIVHGRGAVVLACSWVPAPKANVTRLAAALDRATPPSAAVMSAVNSAIAGEKVTAATTSERLANYVGDWAAGFGPNPCINADTVREYAAEIFETSALWVFTEGTPRPLVF